MIDEEWRAGRDVDDARAHLFGCRCRDCARDEVTA